MMRPTLRFLKFSLAAFLALGAVRVAHAQIVDAVQATPRMEVFGGYSYIRANTVITGTQLNLNGASGSMAYNVNRWLGLVGDAAIYRQDNVTANGLSLKVSSYQFGPRVSLRNHKHLIPFGQVLLGIGHAGGTLYTTSLGPGLAPLGTNNGLLLTTGGGINWKLNHRVGIRLLQAEYLYSQFQNGSSNNNHQNNLRISTGVVFSFGQR